jgi:hypothetical protein
MDTHRTGRKLRDATCEAARDSAGSLADRAKYQSEPDSEDDEMENEIDDNLGMFYIHGDSDS